MKMNFSASLLRGILFCIITIYWFPANAQGDLDYPGTEEGVEFKSEDSSMQLTFNARMQNRFELVHYPDATESDRANFLVRRMRLKSNGYFVDPRLTYKIELAFSGRDIGGRPDNLASVILDAYGTYALTPNLKIQFGQFKLPGNRQRVISSQNLQLVDRSVVNSNYTLDRDVGIMLLYNLNLGKAQFRSLSSVSNGEGRNVQNSNGKINETGNLDLALTQRFELLPFGAFKGKGDYFEGDLLVEPTPKLSIAAGYSHNENAVRQRGQRGRLLFGPRDINTVFSDLIFKYRGWSLQSEYMLSKSENPITELDGERIAVENGQGFMLQAGKLLPSFWEISARYGKVIPDDAVENFHDEEEEILIGISRYVRGHRIKVQSDVGYIVNAGLPEALQEHWQWRLQMEIGF